MGTLNRSVHHNRRINRTAERHRTSNLRPRGDGRGPRQEPELIDQDYNERPLSMNDWLENIIKNDKNREDLERKARQRWRWRYKAKLTGRDLDAETKLMDLYLREVSLLEMMREAIEVANSIIENEPSYPASLQYEHHMDELVACSNELRDVRERIYSLENPKRVHRKLNIDGIN